VFDAGGARIRRLAGSNYDAGFHPLRWDGRDDQGRVRSAGVYFVRVSTLGEVLTTRVVKIE
jgi:flagellar hook assembly protein FlgD